MADEHKVRVPTRLRSPSSRPRRSRSWSRIARVGARSSSFHRLPTGEIARSILLGARETMFRTVPGELTSR